MKTPDTFSVFLFLKMLGALGPPPMALPQVGHLRSWKICILETESCNLVNTFTCKFDKGNEKKNPNFTSSTDPNCALL